MSFSLTLFGRDTCEAMTVALQARGNYWEQWKLEDFQGPVILYNVFNKAAAFKPLFLYPEHLSLLYSRFKDANPSGTEIGPDDWYERAYPPKDMPAEQFKKIHAERSIYVDLTLTDEDLGYPHLKKYLPEIFDGNMLEKMAADPRLDLHLLGRATSDGLVPNRLFPDPRWSPEWRTYCDKLILPGDR